MKYDISSKYKADSERYDELFFKEGTPRKITEKLLKSLRNMTDDEAERRQKRLNYAQYYQALIKSPNDIDTKGLDSIPYLFSHEEWEKIEEGLAQRAKLYDLIVRDIYGEQKLVKEKIVPPALIYANPNFLQMLWTEKTSNNCFINLMSTDIVRSKDGEIIAVNDRFQIPEGLGNTLENRLSMARAYPELFHDLNVKRINEFFANFRQTILSGDNEEESNAVLLASEPERYQRSEDAILAKYLKLQLVENDDLSVRGFKVYLKTLAGLKKIDTILRRVEDGMCDPLELRIDSGEGAVGLISAVRSGNVKIINALGTGILETPIIRAFLPQAAQYFLGEELLIKPVKTYWLGDENSKEYALNNPEKLMFYNAFEKTEFWIYEKMTPTAQLALSEKIIQNPEGFTAEEYVQTSTTPYVQDGKYCTGDAHFRLFSTNTKEKNSVLPGGYGWVADKNGKKVIEKDIWVISGGEIKNQSGRNKNVEAIALSRAGGDLPSRTADNLFRLGKNLERAELLTRIARGVAKRLADRELSDIAAPIPYLLKSWQENIFSNYEYEDILWNLSMKKTEDAGLQPIFKQIRFLAVQLRDRISEDTWQFIKSFGEHNLPEDKDAAALLPYMQRIIADSAAFEGLISEGMTRGHGWRFLDIGRRISRGILTLKLIKNMLNEKTDNEQEILTSMLEVSDGSLTYYRRYGTKLHAAPVIDLLMCDESNPHSVAYQAALIEKTVSELPKATDSVSFSALDKEILKLTSQLRLADIYNLIKDNNEKREILSKYCEARIKEFENTEEMLNREYFSHIPQKGIKAAMATEV